MTPDHGSETISNLQRPFREVSGFARSLRPSQWIKNLLVFAAVVFAKRLTETDRLLLAGAAFGLFCAISGAVYVLNDLLDLRQDRVHPEKRHRPLASGALSIPVAVAGVVLVLPAALILAFRLNLALGWIAVVYFLQSLLYSLWLKRVVILDVMVIALGFVWRAVAGAVAVEVEVSSWLILCTFLLSLFLGFSKRRQEIVRLKGIGEGHRPVLVEYSPQFLDTMMGIVAAATLMSYALYTTSEQTLQKFGTTHLVWTTPFVIYGIFRYLYLMHQHEKGDNPTRVLLTDPAIIADILLWLLTAVGIIYLGF